MKLTWRVALMLAVMFWQGGFMFYGAVVVPVGTAVLESELVQGFITRSVTWYLNAAGLVALLLWGGDGVSQRRLRPARLALWAALTAMWVAQVFLWHELDGRLDYEEMRVLDRPRFRNLHIAYLIVSTVQWAGAVALTALTLRAWGR